MSGRKTDEARAGHDRILDWIEASLWLALLGVGILVALAALRDSEARSRFRASVPPAPTGLIEAEDLEVIAKSRDFSFWRQPSSGFPAGKWSKDAHMFAHDTRLGDWIELRLPKQAPGVRSLALFMTKAADYAIVSVSVDGNRLGEFDLWSSPQILPTGELSVGDVEVGEAGGVLRIEVVGKNPNSAPPYYQFAIDGIRFGPAGASDEARSDAESATSKRSDADTSDPADAEDSDSNGGA